MPFGSELVCWPDRLSTGAQHFTGGLDSETEQRVLLPWKVWVFLLKSARGKTQPSLLMAAPPLSLTLSLWFSSSGLFLAAFILQKQVESSSLWICRPMPRAHCHSPSSQATSQPYKAILVLLMLIWWLPAGKILSRNNNNKINKNKLYIWAICIFLTQ